MENAAKGILLVVWVQVCFSAAWGLIEADAHDPDDVMFFIVLVAAIVSSFLPLYAKKLVNR